MMAHSNEEREMANRARDWFAQAEKDLDHAALAQDTGSHDGPALRPSRPPRKRSRHCTSIAARMRGATSSPVCEGVAGTAADDLVDRGMVLDNFDVPSRYPNGHPEGDPFEHYGSLQSNKALVHARAIIAFVRAQMAGS